MSKAIPNPGLADGAAGQDPNDSTAGDVRLWDGEVTTGFVEESRIEDGTLLAALEADSRDGMVDAGVVQALQAENAELRQVIETFRGAILDRKDDQKWQQQQEDYEARLEEKAEVIRQLHLRIEELEAASVPQKRIPKEDELLAMSEELERERCQLQQEQREVQDLRKHLAEDESTMQQQMREVEVHMARERADYARRRAELQRILEEIRRELDKVERNGNLNQRLSMLRQRYVENAGSRMDEPPAESSGSAPPAHTPQSPADSSMIRRLFKR